MYSVKKYKSVNKKKIELLFSQHKYTDVPSDISVHAIAKDNKFIKHCIIMRKRLFERLRFLTELKLFAYLFGCLFTKMQFDVCHLITSKFLSYIDIPILYCILSNNEDAITITLNFNAVRAYMF